MFYPLYSNKTATFLCEHAHKQFPFSFSGMPFRLSLEWYGFCFHVSSFLLHEFSLSGKKEVADYGNDGDDDTTLFDA